MSEFERLLDKFDNLTEKLDALTLKVERHLSKHETTGANAKWLKWFFDFARTSLLIYIAVKGLF